MNTSPNNHVAPRVSAQTFVSSQYHDHLENLIAEQDTKSVALTRIETALERDKGNSLLQTEAAQLRKRLDILNREIMEFSAIVRRERAKNQGVIVARQVQRILVHSAEASFFEELAVQRLVAESFFVRHRSKPRRHPQMAILQLKLAGNGKVL